jgi:hypothetical protein
MWNIVLSAVHLLNHFLQQAYKVGTSPHSTTEEIQTQIE